MNPMIRKELRQRMRERRTWVLPSLYLLALGGVVVVTYYFSTGQNLFGLPVNERQGAEIGVAVFFAVVYTQLAVLLLLAPIFSAGALTIEKEQRTLASLLTSLLSSAEIWWGKFVAAMLFLTLLLVSALPVLSLVFSLGGVGPLEVLRATGMTLLLLAAISAMGLYFSSTFRRSVHATAVSYAAVIALTLVTFVVYLILESHWQASLGQQQSELVTGEPPGYVKAPLYLNPFFALTVALARSRAGYPDWLLCAQLFVALGSFATALALRNIERGGEQG